jgi:hypothetical protein
LTSLHPRSPTACLPAPAGTDIAVCRFDLTGGFRPPLARRPPPAPTRGGATAGAQHSPLPWTPYPGRPPGGRRARWGRGQETCLGPSSLEWLTPVKSLGSSCSSVRSFAARSRLGIREVHQPSRRARGGEPGSPAHEWSRRVGAPSTLRVSCGDPGGPTRSPPIEPGESPRPHRRAAPSEGRLCGGRRGGREWGPCGVVPGAVAKQHVEDSGQAPDALAGWAGDTLSFGRVLKGGRRRERRDGARRRGHRNVARAAYLRTCRARRPSPPGRRTRSARTST